MHQFGHVYALQQELLNPNANNWFRAVELWHTAREEGVAMNSSHFSSILRQCVIPGAWEQSLQVLAQMRRESIRPDVIGVGCALAACVEGRHYDEVEKIFENFHNTMLLDSVCYLALIRARQESGNHVMAIEAGRRQQRDGIDFLPYTYTHLLEACRDADDTVYALELAQHMRRDSWLPEKRALAALETLSHRHKELPSLTRLLDGNESTSTEPLLPLSFSPSMRQGKPSPPKSGQLPTDAFATRGRGRH